MKLYLVVIVKFLYIRYILYDSNSIVRDCKYREIRRGSQERYIEGEKENKREGERVRVGSTRGEC